MKAITMRAPRDWKKVNLYLLADWHWGSPQCKTAEIRRLIKRISEDKNGVWIGCGDLAENALITSVGDVYKQTVSPQTQLGQLVLTLEPIADQCLAMISGNHGQRTSKTAGLDPDCILAALLGVGDLDGGGKYCGASALIDVLIGNNHKNPAITRWTLYVHHGAGGGRTKGGKANAAGRGVEIVEGADIYVVAHHHADMWITDRVSYLSPSSKFADSVIRWRRRHFTSCLSALGYSESYAEAKMMPPASVGQVVLTIGSRIHRRHGSEGADCFEKPVTREVVWF